jgi:hypothetical protein
MIAPSEYGAIDALTVLDSGSLTHYNGAPNKSLVRNNKPNRLRGSNTQQAKAQVAQLVEHCTENAGVGGSIPPLGTSLQN